MKTSVILGLGLLLALASHAQTTNLAAPDTNQSAPVMSTPAASPDDMKKMYDTAVENRTVDILKKLNLSDETKSNQVHDILVAQYHALHDRDLTINAQLKSEGKEANYANRATLLMAQPKSLHDDFVTKLGGVLTPDQVEKVKDLMTYNKVSFTYSAYTEILPNLTDADKAKVMDLLKAAREEAIDGGNAPEKAAIFQKYKDQINIYLNAQGHDVAQATKDWQAKHPTTAAAK
jgi:hypothetical protein